MKDDNLRIILSKKLSKNEIFSYAKIVNPYNCDKILPLIAENDKYLSGNSAYILLYTSKATKIWLVGQAAFIMEVAQTTTDEKTKRLLMSILVKLKLDAINIDIKFLNYCLENIVSTRQSSAIRSLCIKLSFKLSTAYTELLTELKMILENMESSTLKPSVACARKNILKNINSILYQKTT